PSVIGDFADVIFGTEIFDEALDIAIVNNVSLRGHDRPLLFPHIVWHMITPHPKRQRILWYPEVREYDIFLIVAAWRENQHEGRDICTAGKVEACVALAPDQRIGIYCAIAFVPRIHRHPAHRLLNPLVES